MQRLRLCGVILIASTWALAAPAQYGDISDLKVARPEDKMDVQSVPPPPGAIVLFDGKNLEEWVKTDGKTPPSWELTPAGAMQVKGGSMMTRRRFDGHFKLHVEFRVPYMPDKTGQARGNSGVYLQGRYEVQILDSYGLKSQDNDCGGIYKVATPLVNACKAPTVWQSYDIDFRAPRFESGKKIAPARISVLQNGKDPRRHRDSDRQHRGRPGRRPQPKRPDHASRSRQPGAIPQHLARSA
jgi:hypothetical protein